MVFQNGVLSLFECDHFSLFYFDCFFPPLSVGGGGGGEGGLLLAISGMQHAASACHTLINASAH